jgi:hypothetical protein
MGVPRFDASRHAAVRAIRARAEVFAVVAGPRVSPGSSSVALPTSFLRLRAGDESVRMEHHAFVWAHGYVRVAADGCAWWL